MANFCILIAILLPLALFQCPPTLYDTSIIADSMTLASFLPSQSQYSYTFRQQFDELPQVTIGIVSFSINTTISNQYQFFWMNTTGSRMGIQVSVQPGVSSWVISKITLIASSNSNILLDLLTGSFSNPASQSYQGNIEFKLNSKNYFTSNQPLVTRTFLTGINAPSALTFLSLANSSLLANQLTLSILAIINSNLPTNILVALIAFPVQTNNFSAYGGLSSISTPGIQASDLIQSLSATQNIFYGINGVGIGSTFSQISFTASIDNNFILNLTLSGGLSSFQISYLFLGNPPQRVCGACLQNGQESIYSQNGCVVSCPAQNVLVTIGSGQVCRVCPSALNLGYLNGECIQCGLGTVATEGVCVPSALVSSSFSNFNSTQFSSSGISQGSINQITRSQIIYATASNQITISQSNYSPVSQTPSTAVLSTISQLPALNVSYPNAASGIISTINTISSSRQCPVPDMFWNGNQCVCIVGYIMVVNVCIQIYLPYPTPNILLPSTNTTGQIKGDCPLNSINNGLGVCICLQSNYQLVNGNCQLPNCISTMRWNGTQCVCDNNHPVVTANGSCLARCPLGQLWNNGTCLIVCGLNMQYDSQQRQCVCIPGFAFSQGGQCQQCQTNYYILNGYCVTCPIYSSVSISNNICMCQTGYIQNPDGTCSPKCSSLQVYNSVTGSCACLAGLGVINGICAVCPNGTHLQNGLCINCPTNSALNNGQCLCISGYILDFISRACLPCASLPNSFSINGLCAICPNNQIYNVLTASCYCPSGTVLNAGNCVQACQSDQLLDANGSCYACQNNMVISGTQCVCIAGYVFVSSGCSCQLKCLSNQFQFMGVCGQCPLNMVYLPNLQGCVCPSGYYLSSISNICELSPVILANNCTLGQYYNSASSVCVNCPQYCSNCTSSSCLQCLNGYQPSGNNCQTVCGDGIIAGTQNCDTGQLIQSGCVNCKIITGYSCTGQPSICNLILPPSPNTNNTDSLTLKGNVNINSNNIYVTLATNPSFSFPNNQTKQTFIQANFKNTNTPTMYCQQQAPPNLELFDCLFIYPNGVPNNKFNISFSYNYQSHSASLTLLVNPISPTKTLINN